jgi:6-phosphogluconolactonase (cycloisomerase 2 family)
MKIIRLLISRLFLCFALCAALTATALGNGYLYVLAEDPAGSRIYGFNVNEATGALTALAGFPVNVGQNGGNALVYERMAIDAGRRRLYVNNDGSDTVSAYSIGVTGALTEMPFSPIALGTGTWNTIAVHPSGSPLLVGDGATPGKVLSFNINIIGTTATPAEGSPFATGGATAIANTFSPNGNYFYVGGNNGTTFAGFSVDAGSGVLTALPGSPFNSGAANPISYAMDNIGRLFTFSSVDTINIFTTASGVPSPVMGNPFPPGGMTQRRDALIHPNQNFYIVSGNSGNNVGVFQIGGAGANTTLTPVPGSPFPSGGGATANVLAINRTGSFLYLGNRLSRNLTTYAVDASTGILTNLGIQPSNTLGTTGFLSGMAYTPSFGSTLPKARADFDGDGRTDFSVFRSGTWHLRRSTAGFATTQFGLPSDKLVPADYDGDGKIDIAVWREAAFAHFYILQSSNNTVRGEQFGTTGDVPIGIGYWDNDGQADVAVYRAAQTIGGESYFFYRPSSQPGVNFIPVRWGTAGDIPVNGDFDGEGRPDAAVFRPSEGRWYIRLSALNQTRIINWGAAGDRIVPADFDGDFRTDAAVFRNGVWYILNSSNNQPVAVSFGNNSDILVPGDYDGDWRDDIAVFRDGIWHRINSSNNSQAAQAFGQTGDVPVPAAFNPQ